VTSYTPTLATLLRPAPPPHAFRGILAVGQSATAGQSSLPGTIDEIDRIEKCVGTLRFKRLAEEKATVSSVLRSMEEYSWIHFACHASQDTEEPTSSAFFLHDGSLGLTEITKKMLPHAGLAFLSACQTALGDEKLPDEAVHLASGMIMVGYPTLIATMWSINDNDAPLIAEGVYAALFEGGMADSSKASIALHKAVQHLRMRVGEKEFISWVPFVHLGL
jgi:CHAT domain-containing protein